MELAPARLEAPKRFDTSYLSPTMAAKLMPRSKKVNFGDCRFLTAVKIILYTICQTTYLANFILILPFRSHLKSSYLILTFLFVCFSLTNGYYLGLS